MPVETCNRSRRSRVLRSTSDRRRTVRRRNTASSHQTRRLTTRHTPRTALMAPGRRSTEPRRLPQPVRRRSRRATGRRPTSPTQPGRNARRPTRLSPAAAGSNVVRSLAFSLCVLYEAWNDANVPGGSGVHKHRRVTLLVASTSERRARPQRLGLRLNNSDLAHLASL